MRKDNFLYIHKDITITDASELVSGKNAFSLVRGWNLRDLLNYEVNGVKNIYRIFLEGTSNLNFIFAQKNTNKIETWRNNYEKDLTNLANKDYSGVYYTTKLFRGTKLYFPRSKWVYDVMISEGTITEEKDYEPFLGQKLTELFNDAKYYSSEKTFLGAGLEVNKQRFPTFTIWLWSRALNNPAKDKLDSIKDLNGTLINITQFCKRIETNVNQLGGTFTLGLSPIIGEWSDEGWRIKKGSITKFESNGQGQYIAQGSIEKKNFNNDKIIKRNRTYFEDIITENDLVLIRFETLNNELPGRLKEQNKDEVSAGDISNNIYDMIGLVDSIQPSTDFSQPSISINVQGRDLMKVLIEDGCYFYPAEFTPNGIFSNDTRSNYLQRIQGQILSLTSEFQKSIENSLKFIFNALSNTEIVPDWILAQYPDNEKTKRFEWNDTFYKSIEEPDLPSISGEEKTVKIILTKKYNFSKEDINDLYQGLYNFIEVAAERNALLVEPDSNIVNGWLGFNWGEFIVERNITPDYFYNRGDNSISLLQPAEEDDEYPEQLPVQSYLTLIYNIYLKNKSLSNKKDIDEQKNQRDLEDAKGIWKIIKLAIDDDIRNRILVDNTIGNEMGSILNYCQKVCQEPFVEFFSDTYKNQFYFVARKPPFDKVKTIEYLERYIENIDALNIYAEDVKADSLAFTSNSSYSWYRIIPQGPLSGQGASDIAFAYIKAVHFPEYAKIWGERPLEIYSNYISNYIATGAKEASAISNIIFGVIKDLVFLIESNAYLPFTRQGTISLNGDRRIKRGTWVKYHLTGEIFYVDSVTQELTHSDKGVSRTTILNVSRGMVEKYVKPIRVNNYETPISYFNIIDTNYSLKYKTIQVEKTPERPIFKESIIFESNKIGKVLDKQEIREHDKFGSGRYGSSRSRDNGTRKGIHKGLDLISSVGDNIYAPISGKLENRPPHSSLPGIGIRGIDAYSGTLVKIFYVKTTIPFGSIVNKGDIIGQTVNIIPHYGLGITNHIHFELYINNQFSNSIDPTLYLFENKLLSKDQQETNPNLKYGRNWITSFEMRDKIKVRESFLPYLTLDPPNNTKGLYSIGYGHQLQTRAEKERFTKLEIQKVELSKYEAESIFQTDIAIMEPKIKGSFGNYLMNQNQFDALIDFVYTAGSFKPYHSLTAEIKKFLSDPTIANKNTLSAEWVRTAITSQGRFLPGLVNRRKFELEWFLRGYSDNSKNKETEEILSNSVEKIITEEQVLDLEGITSKFKVNKDVFNFFLRKQQFADE